LFQKLLKYKIKLLQFSYKKIVVLGLFFIFLNSIYAQNTFKMGNGGSSDCRGKLTDSEENTVNTTYYASNEDYIFTICVKGASSINFKFASTFQIESGTDFLRAHKGRDTTGTQIGKWSGNTRPTGTFTANDSCMTFYFHSDKNYNLEGFELSWEAKITTVPTPKFTPISNPTCNSTKIRIVLDQKLNCDSVKAKNFKLSGTLSTAISGVTPIGCDSKNETNTFDITFASGLNKSGNYTLDFNTTFKDKCDSIWKINAKLNFKIIDCPIKVILRTTKDTICKGSCATLTATVTGGNPANYAYTWISGGLSGLPPKYVCPTVDTRYILEVADGVSVAGKDTIDIVVVTPPVAQNDTIVCQSSGAFNLTSYTLGGKWSGTGITNATNGTFNPAASGAGVFKIAYTIGKCADTVVVTVRAINAGAPNASCPSAANFMVYNFSPPGGTWSGPNITTAGLITPPSSPGSFVVTYTWNGCNANKTINIDGIVIKQFDTVCKSKTIDTIAFTPIGGSWAGPSVTNAIRGYNNPNAAGAGNKRYIYSINGCKDTLERFIKDVDARWDEVACPDAGQRTLPAGLPAGGKWSGKGIFDAANGIFDADSFRVPGKSTFVQVDLTYTTLEGCKDDKVMYLRYSRFYKDTVKNCLYDTAYFLRWQYVQNDPWNLLFSGSAGIVGSAVYYQKFSPILAGSGFHQVIGDGNGCKDTIIIQVYPKAKIQNDTTFCIADDPFKLYNGEKKGTFSGRGITNGVTGIFSPSVAGIGVHKILFNLPGKCIDTVKITVISLPAANILGLKPFYCFKDTLINLTLNPLGGLLTGKGIIGSAFNPKAAGTGTHNITYKIGTGKCVNSIIRPTEVGDTLRLTLSSTKDSICIGNSVALNTISKGGSGTHILRWNSGQYNVQAIYVSPKVSTLYTASLSDGCSDSVILQKLVYVHPQLYSNVTTSPIKCYGERGFINLTMIGAGKFTYLWNTVPAQNTANINAPVSSSYRVKVTNTSTGCIYDTMATIPGYPRIRAYFSYSPSGQCLYSNNAELQVINLSEGGTSGTWDFGDGTVLGYDPNTNPIHLYDGDADKYKITLRITNLGGCIDSFSQEVCVLDTVAIFLPTGFTPNDDDLNETFKIVSTTIAKSKMQIFNRWGEKVFESTDHKVGWDGKYKGNLCPNDYYVYYVSYKGKKTPMRFIKGYVYLIW